MRYWIVAALANVLLIVSANAQNPTDIFVQLATIDNAPPTAPVFRTKDAVEVAIEKCAKESVKTEFDTAQSVVERASKAPCKFVGISTFKGRGDTLAGDLIKYDPEHESASWSIPTRAGENLRYGQVALPYDLPSVMGKNDLNPAQKAEMKKMMGTSFLFLPLSGGTDEISTYEATNGFGAKVTVTSIKGVRSSIALDTGKQYMIEPFQVGSIPLPRSLAPDLIPNLDLQLYWVASKPCDSCLAGGRLDSGTINGPTFTAPQDIKLKQTFVFAKLVAVRFVDRRNGKTYAIFAEGKASLNKN